MKANATWELAKSEPATCTAIRVLNLCAMFDTSRPRLLFSMCLFAASGSVCRTHERPVIGYTTTTRKTSLLSPSCSCAGVTSALYRLIDVLSFFARGSYNRLYTRCPSPLAPRACGALSVQQNNKNRTGERPLGKESPVRGRSTDPQAGRSDLIWNKR